MARSHGKKNGLVLSKKRKILRAFNIRMAPSDLNYKVITVCSTQTPRGKEQGKAETENPVRRGLLEFKNR
jgi:hypothetical protein